MAIDTAAKRASALTFGWETFAMRVPEAGNLNTDEERGAVLFGYLGSPSAPAGPEVNRFDWSDEFGLRPRRWW